MKKALLFSLLLLLAGMVFGQSTQPGVTNEVVVQDSAIFLISTEVKKVALTPALLDEQLLKLTEEIRKTEQYLTDLRANMLELERVKAKVYQENKKLKKQ